MSEQGIHAARRIQRVQPKMAAVLAAELCNALTPASCAVADLSSEASEEVHVTISKIMEIARALKEQQPKTRGGEMRPERA
jgi:hypothetical protein